MRLEYDLNIGALYISLSDHDVTRTQILDDNTSIDLDDADGVVGIEVISTGCPWPVDEVLRDYRIPAGEAAQIRAYFQPVPQEGTRRAPLAEADQKPPSMSFAYAA